MVVVCLYIKEFGWTVDLAQRGRGWTHCSEASHQYIISYAVVDSLYFPYEKVEECYADAEGSEACVLICSSIQMGQEVRLT